MALIPDEAIDRMGEITPKAFALYAYYCKHRNKESGLAWPSLSSIATDLDTAKGRACELRRLLIEKGWLELVSADTVRLKMGFGDGESHSQIGNSVLKLRTPKRERRSQIGNAHSQIENDPFSNGELHIRKNQLIEPAHRTKEDKDTSAAPTVRAVFDFWRTTLNHPASQLTPKRERAVKARLKQGYTPDALRTAILGCRASPFHQGEKDGKVFDDLELICRDGEHVEQFIAIYEKSQNGRTTQNQSSNGTATERQRSEEIARLTANTRRIGGAATG